jgi:hypothetical protein
MYANLNNTMTSALDAARRESASKAAERPARAAPVTGALRSAAGRMLVRAGTRLAPETALARPVADIR